MAGGVQKEYFQVLLRELFDAKYGMWTYSEETRLYYFSTTSFEGNIQYSV